MKDTSRFAVFCLLAFSTSTVALASELSEAKAAKDKAAQQYYEGVKKLGPNATDEARAELRAKVVTPSQAGWLNAVSSTMTRKFQEIRKRLMPGMKRADTKMTEAKVPGQPMVDEKVTPVKGGVSAPESAPVDEGPGLDGSNIPKEIEFKKSTKPSSLRK